MQYILAGEVVFRGVVTRAGGGGGCRGGVGFLSGGGGFARGVCHPATNLLGSGIYRREPLVC